MPPTWGAEMDSCMTHRCFRLIFLPENMKIATAIVTTPMPPTWISSRMTSCPKGDQYRAVSWTTRPVTHVAEVAVNRASKKEAPPGAREAKGSMRSRVPARISRRKPRMMICAGVIRSCFQNRMNTPPLKWLENQSHVFTIIP